MPTYEYACVDCGQHVEVVQSFGDDPLAVCGACGGRLRKVFHPAGILFKGSGFYSTDNRKGSKVEAAAGAGEEKGASASGSSGEGSGGAEARGAKERTA
ncbi:MAG TPA: FmdB family zinc ribbon protein [Actinomycetota bacterium]|nr:FmdB family zinc ribbon protein [Actinomycetota bacterium]